MNHTPKTLRRPLLALVALLVAAMVLAACGGGDDEGSTDAAADTTLATETGDDATDETVIDTPEDGELPEDGSMTGVEDLSAECQQIYQQWTQSFSGMMDPESADPALLGDAMRGLKDLLPSEYDGDIDIVADAFGEYGRIMADAGGDMASIMSDPDAVAALEAIGTPEVESAVDRVGTYFEEGC